MITLRSHQEEDVAWLASRRGGILGHGVGGGKTFAAVLGHRKATSDGRLLVVCPLQLIRQWVSEIHKVWPEARCESIHSSSSGRERSPDERRAVAGLISSYDVLLVNYDLLPRLDFLATYARNGAFAGLICDEAHRLKGYRGQRARSGKQSKALFGWSDFIPFRAALTGTPILNGPEDAFGIARVVGRETFGDSWPAFEAEYFYDVSRDRNYKILRLRQDKAFEFSQRLCTIMRRIPRDELRKRYSDFMPELLDPVVYHVSMPAKVAQAYRELQVLAVTELESGRVIERRHILSRMMALAMIASGSLSYTEDRLVEVSDDGEPILEQDRVVAEIDASHKLSALDSILESIGDEDEQVVIWAHFRHELELVQRHLDGRGIKNVLIYGGLGAEGARRIDAFQAGAARIALIQPACGGEGLNLQNAGHAIYFSRSHSLRDWEQSLGRLPRPGSKYAFVQPYVIISEGTVEEYIHQRLGEKKSVAATITRDGWLEALRNPRAK